MRKTITILLATVLLVSFFVSCNNEEIVDNAFTCIITFNGNGADSEEQAQQRVSKGIGIDLRGNTFVKDGFDLLWWNTEADGSGTIYRNGQHVCLEADLTLYAQWGHLLSEESTAWTDGQVYSFDRNLTIAERITVSGNVTLILPDGYTLTSAKGITVNEGNSFTVNAIGEGTGTVNAVVPEVDWDDPLVVCAAIGGNNCSSGSITINGGNVTATSTEFGAAIGGGYHGNGTVTISGGSVTATSTEYGAAIGGGNEGNGTVTISGGSVTATSIEYGAAIGGGSDGNGNVTINGGNITVSASFSGAGIGCGYTGSGGTIIINGGTITAINAYESNSASIGGCYTGSGVDVTINGGLITTRGGYLSNGIGRGRLGTNDGTLTLGEGVVLQVSSDGSNWSDYDGSTRQRYMRTI